MTTQRKISFSSQTEKDLMHKVRLHNREPGVSKVTLNQLKAVYRRGALVAHAFSGDYSSSDKRVDAFLKLLHDGRPENPRYTQDFDLLPPGHPQSTQGLTAAAHSREVDETLQVELRPPSEFQHPEQAIFNLVEFSDFGYEVIPAFRAAWVRAVNASQPAYDRVKRLALDPDTSPDRDLLPRRTQK